MTSVIGRISANAGRPTTWIISISISSVPYAAEEMPSQDSTPSASGRDSCSLAHLLVDERRAEQLPLELVTERLRQAAVRHDVARELVGYAAAGQSGALRYRH